MLQMEQHTMDTITAWSAKATFGGAAFTIFSDLTLNGFATIIGIIVSVCGLVVMTYYRHKSYQLEKRARYREVDAIEKYYVEKTHHDVSVEKYDSSKGE